MRLLLVLSVSVLPAFLLAQSEDCHCLKPVFEIGLGPQWTLPVLTDQDIGLLTDSELATEAILNYAFHLGIHTLPSAFQAGLEIIQDRKKFNVYYPLYWPQTGSSHWDHYYISYRLGLGANVRYNFRRFYLQGAANYMNEISNESQEILHEPGAPSHYLKGEYGANSGWLFTADIGYVWTRDGRISSALSFGYDSAKHEYSDDQYLQYWTVRNNIIGLMINYQLNKNP
jgi:hypothetical protein